jgi:hypothetical protein
MPAEAGIQYSVTLAWVETLRPTQVLDDGIIRLHLRG